MSARAANALSPAPVIHDDSERCVLLQGIEGGMQPLHPGQVDRVAPLRGVQGQERHVAAALAQHGLARRVHGAIVPGGRVNESEPDSSACATTACGTGSGRR